MKSLLLIMLFYYTNAFALKGNEGANGGHGVRTQAGVRLLDLFEHGVDSDSVSHSADPVCLQMVAATIEAVDEASKLGFCQKLAEIRNRDALVAETILRAAALHKWRFTPHQLQLVEEAPPIVAVARDQLVQIATRDPLTIQISRPVWMEMAVLDRVALLFHEIIYSLIPGENSDARSMRARVVTAYLFDSPPKTGQARWPDWAQMLESDLPVLEVLLEEEMRAQFHFSHSDLNLYVSSQTHLPLREFFQEAKWVESWKGEKFIGFAPYYKVRFWGVSQGQLPENPSDDLRHLESGILLQRAVKADSYHFQNRICYSFEKNHRLSGFQLDYYFHVLTLKRDSRQQKILWKMEAPHNYANSYHHEANSRARCQDERIF